jgi:hypothetical protein
MDHALTPRIAFRLLRKVNVAESKAFQALLNPPASLRDSEYRTLLATWLKLRRAKRMTIQAARLA